LPVLHIMLGIGNDMLKKFTGFIQTNLEHVPPEVVGVKGAVYNTPMLNEWLYMLGNDYNVVCQKYYTGQLVGGDCHRFLVHRVAICDKTRTIFKNALLRKPDTDADIDTTIDVFVDRMQKLMEVFDSIYSFMSQTTPLTVLECDEFEVLCITFGRMWRVYFPGCSITPKMHMIESHAPAQMRYYRCLGDKIESAVERIHHINNKSNRLLHAMKTYESRVQAMLNRRDSVSDPTVIFEQEAAITGTKRPRAADQEALKQEAITAARLARIGSAKATANAFRIQYSMEDIVPVHLHF
jgi:hypothetical protein